MSLRKGFLLRVMLLGMLGGGAFLFCGAVFVPRIVPADLPLSTVGAESGSPMNQETLAPTTTVPSSGRSIAFRHLDELLMAERAVSKSV